MKKLRFSGFTLVELLVVIGIIALLISILLPSLARAREQSRMTKCLSNQREIGKGAATFQNDHKDRLQLVASHAIGGGGAPQSAIDRVDPTRTIFEYYDYPETEYEGALDDPKNKELVIWPVAYGEAASFNFGKKNWKWGARADSYDGTNPALEVRESIEKRAYNLGICPSDKVKMGSPGWPDPGEVGDGTFTATLTAQGDLEADPAADAALGHYYGELSFAMNEDIVGAETPGPNGEILPRCFKGGGKNNIGDEDCFGGDPCAGRRLAGDLDKVFSPSNTLLTVDAGADTGPNVNSAQRIMLVNSDDFLMSANGIDGLVSSTISPGIRANLGTFTYAHRDEMPDAKTLVLPERRHSDGRLNVLFADYHGAALVPVLFSERTSTGGLRQKIAALWADGETSGVWITPYSVGRFYDVKLGNPNWPN